MKQISKIPKREMERGKNNTENEKNVRRAADSTMIYTLAHDIKSPINHVKGLLTIARKMNKDNEVEGFLDMALNANAQLSDKVNELLDMNIRDRHRTSIDLRKLVNGVWEDVHQTRQDIPVEMIHICQVDNQLEADKTRLKSILQNLMENAIKYRKTEMPHHSIVIRSFVSDNKLHIKVSDDGIGMNPEQVEKMFNSSFQADASREGHGMGMYLARKNARYMGGDLHVESSIGVGTTFTLDMPYNRAS